MKKVLHYAGVFLLLFMLGLAYTGISEVLQGEQSNNAFKEPITSPLTEFLGTDDEQASDLPEGCVEITFEGGEAGEEYGKAQQKFSDELVSALRDKAEYVCVRNHLPLEWQELYALDHGLFWVKDIESSGMQWEEHSDGEEATHYQLYHFTYYDLTKKQIAKMSAEIDQAAQEILAQVPEGADDWEATKVVHDELCRRITYDDTMELPHTHDLYGALVSGQAVCSAYSSAFYYLMNELGYPNRMAYSDTHAWNRVYVRSYSSYVDATWDDTDLVDRNGNPYIFYDHFFLKKEEVEAIDDHAITSGDPTATYVDEEISYNYHEHEGYLINEFREDWVTTVFQWQFAKNPDTNLLTVRFADDDSYRAALDWAQDDSGSLASVLATLGYYEGAYLWSNDGLRIINVGLYPSE